jgi:hypothetical protein
VNRDSGKASTNGGCFHVGLCRHGVIKAESPISVKDFIWDWRMTHQGAELWAAGLWHRHIACELDGTGRELFFETHRQDACATIA